ncbi:MAG: RidA family protein [Nitrospira sp.]|nr:RidA family protein [Candidatus Manganitrophaceae bacterium]HIL35423.1 RidA family protein [Candidatus Manganitrophaceae bacterium]
MHAEEKLNSLGLILPPAPHPVATYVPAIRSGNLLFLSGMIPLVEGKLPFTGKIGKVLTLEQGEEAARIALLNALAVIRAECGSLNQVTQIVRLSAHVASAEGFTEQSIVANAASELLIEIFGSIGRHARLALGAANLPLDAPVELEMIVEVAR